MANARLGGSREGGRLQFQLGRCCSTGSQDDSVEQDWASGHLRVSAFDGAFLSMDLEEWRAGRGTTGGGEIGSLAITGKGLIIPGLD